MPVFEPEPQYEIGIIWEIKNDRYGDDWINDTTYTGFSVDNDGDTTLHFDVTEHYCHGCGEFAFTDYDTAWFHTGYWASWYTDGIVSSYNGWQANKVIGVGWRERDDG